MAHLYRFILNQMGPEEDDVHAQVCVHIHKEGCEHMYSQESHSQGGLYTLVFTWRAMAMCSDTFHM